MHLPALALRKKKRKEKEKKQKLNKKHDLFNHIIAFIFQILLSCCIDDPQVRLAVLPSPLAVVCTQYRAPHQAKSAMHSQPRGDSQLLFRNWTVSWCCVDIAAVV